MTKDKCICEQPPFLFSNFNIVELGVDETSGRFANVVIETCKHCKQKWIKYSVQYESFSESGRWYKGKVKESKAKSITPQNTIDYLEKLDAYFYGGSYFKSEGKEGKGKLDVDL